MEMANEKRLIDANEIEDLFYKQVDWGATDLMDAFDDALADAQTVDAVEVKHGRWKWDTGDIYQCTNCAEKSHVKEVMGQPDWNFCPNCGEKMDGDGNG